MQNHFIFLSSPKKREQLKFYRLSDATLYDCINTTYLFIKHFLDNKMSYFEEYGAFNEPVSGQNVNCSNKFNIYFTVIFAEKNVSSFCKCKSYSHFQQKYYCISCI